MKLAFMMVLLMNDRGILRMCWHTIKHSSLELHGCKCRGVLCVQDNLMEQVPLFVCECNYWCMFMGMSPFLFIDL